ncbi:phosphotransferase [Arthrobacter sp. UYCu723]
MDWPSPVPTSADDDTGTSWLVQRAWPDKTPGEFVLEVLTPGRPGVRGAHLRHGHFELIPLDDPGLPALRGEAQKGELISYWPYCQAVVRADGRYIKVFEPGGAVVPAERCAQMDVLLDAGNFTTPRILRKSSQEDVIVFSAIAGPTLNELGREQGAVSDEAFARAWEKWSRAWVAELNGSYGPAAQIVLDSLPLRPAEWEATKMWRRVNDWLRHNENVPELSSQRDALRAAAEQVATNLLRTAPDPLVWSHGDLYDKQIIVPDGDIPPGLLDFDSTARAEAARDLAGVDVRLELHLRHNRMTPARYLTAHTQVLAAAEELHVSPVRFDAYSDAFWLRLALSPLPGRFSLAIAVLTERAAQELRQ